MGNLREHPIGDWIEQYGLTAFVETGTYRGVGLYHAQQQPFEKLVSIDINEVWIERQRVFEKDSRIKLLLGSSFQMIPEAIKIVGDRPVLWWLDAHLPEPCADESNQFLTGRLKYEGNKIYGDDETFPLQKEIEAIVNSDRDHSRDVFLIDDMRVYETGDYGWGNWDPEEKKLYEAPEDATFVDRLLASTHEVKRDQRDHGYGIGFPKGPYEHQSDR